MLIALINAASANQIARANERPLSIVAADKMSFAGKSLLLCPSLVSAYCIASN